MARGLNARHAVKQVDRMLSNPGIEVDQILALWVPFVIGVFRDTSDGRSYCLTQKCSRASRALPHLNAPEPRSLCQPTFDRRG
jgi:hypothetical protein